MARLEHTLLQRLVFDGRDIDLSQLLAVTFIETLGLEGPALLLDFRDTEGILRDDFGLTEGDTVTVAMADPSRADIMDVVLDFTVAKAQFQAERGVMAYRLFASVVWRLKQPAARPVLLNKKGPPGVLAALAPGVKIVAPGFPIAENYHLLPGERPSRLLRQMAKEKGALVYFSRGVLRFTRLEDLMAAPARYSYQHNNPRAEFQIADFDQPKAEVMIRDRVERTYGSFHLTRGFQTTQGAPGAPVEVVGNPNVGSLEHYGKVPVPRIDFACLGNGGLFAGAALDLTFHRNDRAAPLDESLPNRVVVGTVAHHYAGNNYLCRVKGVTPR